MKVLASIAIVAGLAFMLSACGTTGVGTTDGPPAVTTTADKIAAAQQTVHDIRLGVTLAEIAFDGMCGVEHLAPKFCSDPVAQAAYADAKELVASALQTADDALASGGGKLSDADIANLVTDATNDLAHLEAVISDIKAGRKPPPLS